MVSYNLLDEEWLPCLMAGGSTLKALGLRETLVHAPEVRELADASPLVTAALHRLLLAILHRCFGPAGPREWATIWHSGRFDAAKLDDYFGCWRGRFDLFDQEHPFYQCGSLDFAQAGPSSKLVQELASGNNPTLFDHSRADSCSLAAAEAARQLVALQAFVPGGLVSFVNPADRSATAAPMVKGAMALIKGANLFQTLLLNMHRYCPRTGHPFEGQEDDRPAWERDEQTQPRERLPAGYLDLLTWQSRTIRLKAAGGSLAVTQVVIMKGHQFPARFHRHGHETMVAFTRNLKAKEGQDPWPAIGFSIHRSLWQDSTALLRSVDGKCARPMTVDWLAVLLEEDVIERATLLRADFLGLLTDQAKVLLWRHERLPLPLAYLNNRELLEALDQALQLAREVSMHLQRSVGTLARLLLAPNSDLPNARPPKKEAVSALCDSLGAMRLYWPRLEVPFKRLMIDLPSDVSIDADALTVYGGGKLRQWAGELRAAATAAFTESCDGFEGVRAARARARAENGFRAGLNACLKTYAEPSLGGDR